MTCPRCGAITSPPDHPKCLACNIDMRDWKPEDKDPPEPVREPMPDATMPEGELDPGMPPAKRGKKVKPMPDATMPEGETEEASDAV